jgi:hypothetical protein
MRRLFLGSLHQLTKRGKETGVRKIRGQKFCEIAVANGTVRKLTWASLARAMLFTASFPLASQNSLANLDLIAWTSSFGRILEVLKATGNYKSFSRNVARSAQSKS